MLRLHSTSVKVKKIPKQSVTLFPLCIHEDSKDKCGILSFQVTTEIRFVLLVSLLEQFIQSQSRYNKLMQYSGCLTVLLLDFWSAVLKYVTLNYEHCKNIFSLKN